MGLPSSESRKGLQGNCRLTHMKAFSRHVWRAVILVIAISAGAFAEIPNRPPTTAPQPRKKPVAQAGNVQKVARKTKAGKAMEKAVKEAQKRAKKAERRYR
jgi:hypothetical protein